MLGGALGVYFMVFLDGWLLIRSQLAISGDNAFKVTAILSQQILLGCWGALAAMFLTWAVAQKNQIFL
jgi:Amt family ammonium transporter